MINLDLGPPLNSIHRKVSWFSGYLALLLLTILSLVVSFGLYVRAEKQIDRANAVREQSLGISDQMRQSSLDLTSLARAYVVTGDSEYRQNYLRVLAIRDGKLPRPNDHRSSYWELYEPGNGEPTGYAPATPLLQLARDARYTPAEFTILAEVKRHSDELARTELAAMDLVEPGRSDATMQGPAVRMLYDPAYRAARVDILEPISEVDRMIDERTRAAVAAATSQALSIRYLVISIGLLQIFLLWRTRRQLHAILGGSVKDLYLTITRLGRGDFTVAASNDRAPGDDVLSWVTDTQHKLASLELRQFKAIVDSSDDAIIGKTPDGVITSWNAGAQNVFGYSAAEAIGRPIDFLIPVERAAEETEILRRLARGERVSRLETQRIRKDGRLIDISATISPIEGEDGKIIGVSKIARDMTELNQLAAEVRRHRDHLEREVRERTAELHVAKDAAEGANRAKSVFLATTSHELRTPLNAIIGFSALLLDGMMGEVSAEQRRPLAIINQSGVELFRLVQEILDLSSIEAGNLKLHSADTPLRGVLDEVQESLQPQADDRGLELRPVVCDPSLVVHADRARLAQVIRNLMGNALKFTDRGHLQVRADVDDDKVRIVIEDTGIGVPADKQAKLFRPFERVPEPNGALRPGTGLGLSICKRIVEAMGGTVGIDSEPGRGSRFWFTVPLTGQTVTA